MALSSPANRDSKDRQGGRYFSNNQGRMRAVIQRVTRASVTVDGELVGEIGNGLVVLLGIARDDTEKDATYLVEKIAALRIFDDNTGVMNVSVRDLGGAVLIVSQFTLYGDVRRGLRPSWIDAAAPET